MKSDLQIAQEATIKPIVEIAETIGLTEDDLIMYGKYKAKIKLDVIKKNANKPNGKYIGVTAITPTPLGEGKTVTNIGLTQGLAYIGKNVVSTLREPSMGPVFGIKGGAAGGGYSQVIPMEDINLHFTGDMHAVTAAHNLCAAMADSHVQKDNKLGFDITSGMIGRVLDVNDRALRKMAIGLGGWLNGIPREASFDITAASEVMAILCLATDLHDLRKRLGRMVVGFTRAGESITADDIGAAGAMTALLKDAIQPNLVQTLEGTATIMHGGPFANIAHGNNTNVADIIALKMADYVVTESGFGADMGAEKLYNIKCRAMGITPDCAVLVATVKALKMHGGGFEAIPGRKLSVDIWGKPNPDAVRKGCENMVKHIENIKKHGLPVVVALNKFEPDTDEEIDIIRKAAMEAGAFDVALSEVHAKGGEGGAELAKAVVRACDEGGADFKHLYDLNMSIKEKIEKIATEIYGADGVDYEAAANKAITKYTKLGLDKLPICMAKTHLSISHDAKLKGRPTGFRVPIRDVRLSAGAGFIYPLLGTMMTMPGLPTHPAAMDIDIDEEGNITGLF